MLNKLQDMSDSRHLERRYIQVTIKLLKVKYGPEATSVLRDSKQKPAPPEDGSIAALESRSSTSF